MRITQRSAWALAAGLALGAVAASGPAHADEPGGPPAGKTGEKQDEKTKWAEHTGDLPFIVGFEKGMQEVEFTGRPPMYFFTATW